jgi:phosphoglycerol transferase
MFKQRITTSSEWLWWMVLIVLVCGIWCGAYNRWTREAWKTPVRYMGDAMVEMASAKTLASGEMRPLLAKYPLSLGAPFVANWNDYPTVEEGVFAWWAIFARLFGIFAGSNVTLLLAHVLAAGSFYFVCRTLGYHRPWSFAGAILFSMSHFAFARNLSHLILTYYWHVPLGLLVVWWCVSIPVQTDRRKVVLCIAVSILHGIQNPYYTGIFLQFLIGAAFVNLVRRNGWPRILFPFFLVAIVLAIFVLMNADTFYYSLANGPNPAVLLRDYAGIETYALKPLELFLPGVHRLSTLHAWADRVYYTRTMFHGENGSPYLGIIGIVALGLLGWVSFRAMVSKQPGTVPLHSWGIAWILAFSVVGGLNGFMGLFGFVLFRCSNRYSIVILALVLLFLVRELTRLARNWHGALTGVVATAFVLLGLWDQIPSSPTWEEIHRIHNQVVSDGRLVSTIESKLPARAMVFELPVCDYPEVPPILGMLDYEHFRPYLQSRSLRFSYGSQKGRTRERWQSEVMQLGTPAIVSKLEAYGFSAVLINRKAYEDRGASLQSDLRSCERAEVLAASDDLICIRLQPATHPELPPEFDRNWYGLERSSTDNWRWSLGDANLILYNPDPRPRSVHIVFGLGTVQSRRVDIYAGAERIYTGSVDPAEPAIIDLTVSLEAGRNELKFRSDRPGELPGNGDTRKLAFNIRNLSIVD